MQKTSAFNLSRASLQKLEGVHPALVRVVHRAIELTTIDFRVGEGVRTLDRQRALVREGKSKTLNSKHLIHKDGSGHAVDLHAIVSGKTSWDAEAYYPIALAMMQAARELGVSVRWGGGWCRLEALPLTEQALRASVAAYVLACRQQRKSALVDMVHFEID